MHRARHAVAFAFLVTIISTPSSAKPASVGVNFTGTSVLQSLWHPPDSMGAVGPNHIVELVNGRYRVYDKTGAMLQDQSLNGFWNSGGAAPNGFAFDPRVQFDPQANRYYATSVDAANNPNNLLVAVSNSANPLNGWTAFAVDADSDDRQWADFPQMGFNNDFLVISANMFPIGNNDFDVNVLTIPKADLVSATPNLSRALLLERQFSDGGFNRSLQPALDLEGSTHPMRFFTTETSALNEVNVLELDKRLGLPLGVTEGVSVTGLTSYPEPPLAQQPGPIDDLQSGGRRTRSGVKLIDDYYYGVHGVEVNGRAAQRWYKIDADTLSLVDEGVISDPSLDFTYGSIAANASGDVVIGFTATGETMFPSSYAVVGDDNPLTGEVSFGTPFLLKAGVATYQILDSQDRNRWGDYSATVVDPSNPFNFWTFQEFTSGPNEWSIQISQITLDAAGDFNSDGVYDCEDIDSLVTVIANGVQLSAFDLNGDGIVNGSDLGRWLVEAGYTNVDGAYLAGDINLDGIVNGADFVIWNANKQTKSSRWCSGDINADGIIDGGDFALWSHNAFGTSSGLVVPEPQHLTFALLICLGMSFIRRNAARPLSLATRPA